MGLFSRKKSSEPSEPPAAQREPPAAAEPLDEEQAAKQLSAPLGQAEQDRIRAAVQQLQDGGVDLDGPRGGFMVVPGNLVAGRWMRGETGWVPPVVGHLVRCRER